VKLDATRLLISFGSMSSTRDVGQALELPLERIGPALLGIPEDQWYDRKSIRVSPQTLAKLLIAFANADGGTVIVGLSEGQVQGTNGYADHVNELMQAHVQHCQPAVPAQGRLIGCTNENGDSDDLLVIDVRPGDTVYANGRDEVYLRIGDETRRLTYAQRQELLYDRGHGSYESRLVEGALFDDVESELLENYVRALRAPDGRRLLQARGLTSGEGLTVAGVLLFTEQPQRFLPEAFIRVVRYRGRERGTGARQELVTDQRVEGPIPYQLVQARDLIRGEQPRRRALAESGTFDAVPLVPEDAWLEGLVNAAVHRSYSLAGDHIRVEIFSDRIEVESPGRFPGLFNAADPLKAPRYARNPRIARVAADQNFGQELGEGIRRMFDEMRLAGLADPLYEQTQGSVRLTLLAEPVDRQLEARLPRDTRAIISALRDAGQLSTGELAEVVGISRVTASERLKRLREAGLVEWTGKSPRDPRASWSLPVV
jgi:ATP-dependent DNA helicase RecG